VPYSPGISYRGDQWIAEGGQQMSNMAQMLIGYMMQQNQRKQELGATAEALAAPGQDENAPASGGGGAMNPMAPGQAGAPMIEGGTSAAPAADDDAEHPLVTRGRQADALRKLIKSYQPEAKDLHTAIQGMSVGQLEGMIKGYGMQQQASEHAALMEDRAAQAALRRQQAMDDRTIGQAVNRYAQTPEVVQEDDEGLKSSRPPTAEERFRSAMSTPGLAGRQVPKLLETLSKYGEAGGQGARPPVVTKGPYPGVSFVQDASGRGGLHVVTDPESLTTRPAMDADGKPIPGLFERGKSLVRIPSTKDTTMEAMRGRTALLNTKKEYLAEKNKAFLPEDKKAWNDAIAEVDAALAASTAAVKGAAAPAERVTVQDQSGKRFTLPRAQLGDAKKQGYTEVK